MKLYCCNKINNEKLAFTLVEILVVVAIMALLAAITLPVFFNMRTNDRKSTCASNMEALGRALTEYYQDYKKYPPGPRPDYAMKVWAGSSDAFKAIPLSNQPNRGYPPEYKVYFNGEKTKYVAFPLPSGETRPGLDDLLIQGNIIPATKIKPAAKINPSYNVNQIIYTITVTSGSTDANPTNPNKIIWSNNIGESGGPFEIIANNPIRFYQADSINDLSIKFSNNYGHRDGDKWIFRTGVDDLILGGAFCNPYATNGTNYKPAPLPNGQNVLGDNDLTLVGSFNLDPPKKLIYTISIQSGLTDGNLLNPNTFIWSNDIGDNGGPTLIPSNLFDSSKSGVELPLNNGLKIRFDSAYRHRSGDKWIFHTGTTRQLSYKIKIVSGLTDIAPLTPNYYTWSNDVGDSGGPTLIQANQSLILNGLVINFKDSLNHRLNGEWEFTTAEAPFENIADDPKGTCTWMDWRPRGTSTLSADLNVGSKTAYVDTLAPFEKGCWVKIQNASDYEYLQIDDKNPENPDDINPDDINPNVFPAKITFKNPTQSYNFPSGSIIIPVDGTPSHNDVRNYYHLVKYSYLTEQQRRQLSLKTYNYGNLSKVPDKDFQGINNFGLSFLYYKYLRDEGVYLRTLNYLHCPADINSDRIDRTKQLSKLQNNDLSQYRSYDPLQAGYNKYDFTYNYDQYINDIMKFDNELGYGPLHIRRQLCDKNPPVDTVVTWCFQHRGNLPASGPYYFNTEANTFLATNGKTYITPDGQPVGTPIAGVTNDQQADDKMAEYIKQRDVVLWLDGSSGTVTPQIVKSKQDMLPVRYYWLPTFLTSSAEQR